MLFGASENANAVDRLAKLAAQRDIAFDFDTEPGLGESACEVGAAVSEASARFEVIACVAAGFRHRLFGREGKQAARAQSLTDTGQEFPQITKVNHGVSHHDQVVGLVLSAQISGQFRFV